LKKIRGIYFRNHVAYICFQDEQGQIVRESTGQSNAKIAGQILAKRRSEVAMGAHFRTRQFDQITFGELLDFWWKEHGQHTRSRFDYHLPLIKSRFAKKKARSIRPEDIQQFLADFEQRGFAASTINKYRTILCSTFNFAIRWDKFDRNPVRAVPQRTEPPGRDVFLTPAQFNKLLAACGEDSELRAFLILAGTTGARKSEILARRWDEVHLDGPAPHLYIPRTKNERSKRLPLATIAVEALKELPSHGWESHLFPPDRGNVQFTGKSEHRWDIRDSFKAACDRAGSEFRNLRIHDLRHMATTILFLRGIPEAVIRKLTGHRSRELERYEHLSPLIKQQTVELIAKELTPATDTRTDTVPISEKKSQHENSGPIEKIGGDDGARTRDLRRDRPAF
jgi:integrase